MSRSRVGISALAIVLGASLTLAESDRSVSAGADASRVVRLNELDVFDCSLVDDLFVPWQTNQRAALILERCAEPGARFVVLNRPEGWSLASEVVAPDLGWTDRNTITGHESFPQVTQSESFVWGHGQTIVVTYNDGFDTPSNFAGGSYSTDGGATFTRMIPCPFQGTHGINYGDPTVVYNDKLDAWYAVFLVSGCGGQGLGVWSSINGAAWAATVCAHSGGGDDRESMWVDNNPASPYYGRMYISWNDFAMGGVLKVAYSDDGISWTPVTLTGSFLRNVQITGSSGTDGTVFMAVMNEGGGGAANRTNLMYRSTNGGASWSQYGMGPSFGAPGDGLCATNTYFMQFDPIWRHQGGGQPAVGPNGVVHYAYCGRGVNSGDRGDIFYVRSSDNGATWSSPIVLNTDQASGGTRSQWMPSVACTAAGNLLVSWYDRRNTSNYDYEYFGRTSTDNGVSWQADEAISDQVINQPTQPDPNVASCFAGDYNYHSALGGDILTTWTDGRNQVSGTYQQDVYFDRVAFCTAITLSPSSLPNGAVGASYSEAITASGGTGPYTFAVTSGSLPTGLGLSSAGVISGTPTTEATFNFTVTATDSVGCTGSRAYSITIACGGITVLPASLPDGTAQTPYSQTITASGGTGPYTFAVTSGSLPSGLTLSAGGVLSGTPTAVGSFSFKITAADSVGCLGIRAYQVAIQCPAIDLAPSSLPAGQVGSSYVQTITGNGGTSPYTFAVTSGSLPPGLTLATDGVLSGSPTTNGVSNFTVTATDAVSCTGSRAYTLAVATTEEIITGAGPNSANAPVVKTWNHATPPVVLSTWTAYGASDWGVNVGSVDIIGGSTFEVITGPGPGANYGPQVKGYRSGGTAVSKVNFFAYGTLRYGAHGDGGDIDNDGHGEILSSPGPGSVFGPHIRGWNFDATQLTAVQNVNFFAYNTLRFGARVSGGDVDADSYSEIVTGAGAGMVFVPHVRGFNYDGSNVSGIFSFFAFGSGQFGADVQTGDTDTDGRDEICVAHGPDPTQTTDVRGFDFGGAISTFSGATFGSTLGGAELAAGDLDADGQAELVAAPGWGAANPSQVRGFEVVAGGISMIPGLDFTAYASQNYGAKVAVGNTVYP